ncbi:Guanosine-diphosphatase [Mortierella claussenii]|nr:Guanosine-diphosphatase [Mortierella claussenii]
MSKPTSITNQASVLHSMTNDQTPLKSQATGSAKGMFRRRSARIAKQTSFREDATPPSSAPSTSAEKWEPSTKSGKSSKDKQTKSSRMNALKDSIMTHRAHWALLLFLTAAILTIFPLQITNVDDETVTIGQLKAWPQEITSIHCTKAYPGRPLIQYVLMVDAGSMGTRIHAYKFNYCNATPELESETFGHVEPGLSSYADDAEGAAESLDQLLDATLESIPRFLHLSTPIAVKATAGLRLLGEEKSNRILAAVQQRIESKYPFPIIGEQGVAVMDGADEGVFAWVTVNYLLDRFSSLKKKTTVAILDLGGASTQVVFEPRVVDGHSIAQGTHRYPINFNGNEYILYQHSHLGYGLMMARAQINDYVIENPISNRHGLKLITDEYAHPCLPVGLRQDYIKNGQRVTLVGVSDLGGQCRAVVEAIFNKQKSCRLTPCSFNGVYQPSWRTSVEGDIYAFSFFFDLTAPFRLGTATLAQEMTVAELEQLTDRVCVGDEDGFKDFHDSAEAMKEIRKSSDLCMDLSYIYGLLEFGYGVPKDRKIKLAKKLKGYETGWCVGASIAVLEERDWYHAAKRR